MVEICDKCLQLASKMFIKPLPVYIFNNGIIKNYLICRFSEIQYICEQPYIIEICPQDHEAVLDLSQNLCSLIVLIENIKKILLL